MALELTTLVPIAISAGTLGLSWYMTRHKVSYDHMGYLEKRIEDLETRIRECERVREELKHQLADKDQENIRLIRQLVADMAKPNVTVNTAEPVNGQVVVKSDRG